MDFVCFNAELLCRWVLIWRSAGEMLCCFRIRRLLLTVKWQSFFQEFSTSICHRSSVDCAFLNVCVSLWIRQLRVKAQFGVLWQHRKKCYHGHCQLNGNNYCYLDLWTVSLSAVWALRRLIARSPRFRLLQSQHSSDTRDLPASHVRVDYL